MFTLRPKAYESEAPKSRVLRVDKGATIFHEGEAGSYWYEVIKGVVRTCRFHSDGHRQLTAFYHAGDVFGLEEGCYQEAAEAVTAVTVVRHQRLASQPLLSVDAPETALRRALATARNCILLLGRKSAKERVAAFLLSFGSQVRSEGELVLMSRTDIADHLGLTMHTVSRTISELAREGLITLHGRRSFQIADLAGLRRLAGEEGSRPRSGAGREERRHALA